MMMIRYTGLVALLCVVIVVQGETKQNKPGVCPQLIDFLMGLECENPCISDADCMGNLKCCLSDCGGYECYEPIPETSHTKCNIACTKESMPVCGSDGVTYPNACMLNYTTCSRNQRWIKMVTKSACKSENENDEAGVDEKSLGLCTSALESYHRKGLIGAKRPQCDEDGYYLPKQCHASTGYCWCAARDGEELNTPSRSRITELECSQMRNNNN